MKNKIVSLLLVTIAILVVGCSTASPQADEVGVVNPQTEQEQISDNASQQVASAAQIFADQQQLQAARESNTLAECDKISGTATKVDCKDIVTYNLVLTGQLSDCKNIANADLKKQCEVKLLEANEKNADRDMFEKAQVNGDVSLCSKIVDPTDKDDCLINLAYKLKDPQICEQFTDPRTKLDCNDQL
ncbi:hypothetical protein COV81_01805 [Candidatus Peregrinibacteria bacterium CG11_big_fil_rev_8_21_14_0_20_41_10]|nr:MAG: hypothetical protein COV81_01805 [Candidatus Peregrinibacteria bacterium CG11_big_fil_rev_8_21_14_0_20_41_10]PIZ77255.1 MAG: hypothetical protein COY06_00745 [Candidatus Peregrinibacteria bacterium CG_4_10_14_0_2_um_filter_41_8]PJC37723.1 MAG: hypothetical protein CO045_03890 [Candidatus Peregrinibacteria bacterium CG_4_9_14_0_2_um_filter_41_14]